MSRVLMGRSTDICADCSAPDPQWASVNRGVLVCNDCCSIHLSLGRHISQIKSLKKGSWSPPQLTMLNQLVSLGANKIWEHTLLDPTQTKHNRRKPNPRDRLHPTKADFIRAKYLFLTFINKPKDQLESSIEDLSSQLHACVRTNNIDMSLKLLSLGADPNYFHPERGTRPLHIAALSGQHQQVELLVVYGADPGAFDANGKTPSQYAKDAGFPDLGDRLIECLYELTDKLAFYLCGKRPDHRNGQHFIIPEMADGSVDMPDLAKAAKKKLQALPNQAFEDLAMDVYDEIDRRENEANDGDGVPFLPVNPEFSSTRNQGRQKLARFNKREFATLIIDILTDAKRRQGGLTSPTSPTSSLGGSLNKKSQKPLPAVTKVTDTASTTSSSNLTKPQLGSTNSFSDEEPVYDIVASDEDYASIGDRQSTQDLTANSKQTNNTQKSEQSASSDQSDTPITLEEYLQVKRELVESKSQVQQLIQTNKDLRQEISVLHNMIQKLQEENHRYITSPDGNRAPPPPISNGEDTMSSTSSSRGSGRPQSMYETRDRHWMAKHSHIVPTVTQHSHSQDSIKSKSSSDRGSSKASSTSSVRSQVKMSIAEVDYENANADLRRSSSQSSGGSQLVSTDSTLASGEVKASPLIEEDEEGEFEVLPSQEEVVRKTEKITKKIQELLKNAQDSKHEKYIPCSEKIFSAVNDMVELFPQHVRVQSIELALQKLTSGAERLRAQCNIVETDEAHLDYRVHTQHVITYAYEIAQAAKQLVCCFNG